MRGSCSSLLSWLSSFISNTAYDEVELGARVGWCNTVVDYGLQRFLAVFVSLSIIQDFSFFRLGLIHEGGQSLSYYAVYFLSRVTVVNEKLSNFLKLGDRGSPCGRVCQSSLFECIYDTVSVTFQGIHFHR